MSAPNEAWLAWHYARQAQPGYAELTNAHAAVNWAMADAELTLDAPAALAAVNVAASRWHLAFRAWHTLAKERMPR